VELKLWSLDEGVRVSELRGVEIWSFYYQSTVGSELRITQLPSKECFVGAIDKRATALELLLREEGSRNISTPSA